jgi:hypothetical protein
VEAVGSKITSFNVVSLMVITNEEEYDSDDKDGDLIVSAKSPQAIWELLHPS